MAADQGPHPAAGPQVPASAAALIARLGGEIRAELERRLEPLGIGPREFRLLEALAPTHGVSQRALGMAVGIHPNRMVSLVDQLEERGLIQRRQHPSDRRAHALAMTTDGLRLLGQALGIAASVDASLCAELDATQRRQLVALLSRLRAA
ncbi:MAG: MarR family winged helix-turn-helix transcriptional regulator [Streptosporangiaceae bacterium]|jgi:DNA-binding MarR family transcriptional regulator